MFMHDLYCYGNRARKQLKGEVLSLILKFIVGEPFDLSYCPYFPVLYSFLWCYKQ